MELSFCNDSLKLIQSDLLEKKETLNDERSSLDVEQASNGFIDRLDVQYEEIFKLVEELLRYN